MCTLFHRGLCCRFCSGGHWRGMWATFVKSIHPAMGGEVIVFALIVAIIGGLGSMTGSVWGPDGGLSYNYVAYLIPKAALGITMLLLVVILSIKPTGLFREEHDLNKENFNPVQRFRLRELEDRYRNPYFFLKILLLRSSWPLPFCSVL